MIQGFCDMKSKRKCNDCGGHMRCYASVVSNGIRKQFYRCSNEACQLRLTIGQKVVFQKIKRKGEKVFSELHTTTADAS